MYGEGIEGGRDRKEGGREGGVEMKKKERSNGRVRKIEEEEIN